MQLPTDAACELGLGLSEMTPPEQFDDDDNGLEAGEVEELAATQPEQFDEVDEASPHDSSGRSHARARTREIPLRAVALRRALLLW